MATTERPAPAPPPTDPVATARPPDPQPAGDERARSDPRDDIRAFVPRTLLISAALGWRLLVVVAALYVSARSPATWRPSWCRWRSRCCWPRCWRPAVHWLQVRTVPRGVATALVMVGGLALVGGVLTFVVVTFVRGVPAAGHPADRQRRRRRGLADQRPAAAERGAAARRTRTSCWPR